MTVTPVPAPKTSAFKRILWGIAAAFTTPEAIKAEKSLAAIGLTRLAVLVPTASGIIYVAVKALGG